MSVWIVETLIATTLLMALVMMLRRPVAHFLGARAAYCLWLLPLARMLLPALPRDIAAPSPLHSAVDQAGLISLLDSSATMHPAADTLAATPAGGAAWPWLEIGAAFWLLGVILFLAVQAIGYARFRRFILRDATPLGQEGRIRIVSSPQAGGPLAFGIVHPHIVLPADFALRFDPQEQRMAIAHERAHHARGDLAANMVALLMLACHWCNPLGWLAYRAYRADQEQACDARVLALHGAQEAHAYGRAILKAASGRQFAGAHHLNIVHLNPITALKGRLKMLSAHEMSLRRISWGMAAIGLLTLSGLFLTASGSRAAQQVAVLTDRVEGMNFDRLTDWVAQPASASETMAPQAVAPSTQPTRPASPASAADPAPRPVSHDAMARAEDGLSPSPPAPPAPPAPGADLVPPLPPEPPLPPVGLNHGRIDAQHIPSDAEIRRMVPRVDVANGCEDGKGVTQRETVDANGRRHIRVRICQELIEAQAHRAARAGLIAARAQIAAAVKMSDRIRAEVLRDLDREIAQMDGQD